MKENVVFYQCKHCKNTIGFIKNNGPKIICCGEPMEPLVPNTTDAATEKHVPVVKKENGKLIIEVGSVAHPMTPEHHIEWIAVVGENYTQRVSLNPGDEPKTIVCDMGDAKVYAYCNLHGLWMA